MAAQSIVTFGGWNRVKLFSGCWPEMRQRIASLEAENSALVTSAADEAEKLTNANAAITRARKACSEWKTSYKTERNKRIALQAIIGQKEYAE